MSFRQGARQFFERRGTPVPPLPYDAEVEYLECTGEQYIDTQAQKPGVGAVTEWSGAAGYDTRYTGSRNFVAAYNYEDQMYYCEFNQNQFGGVGWGQRYFCTPILSSDILYDVSMKLEGDTVEYTVDAEGQTYVPPPQEDVAISNPFLLFRLSRSFLGAGVMIGRNKLIIDDVLVRDFIPVRFTNELGQPEGAMYDRVSGALFRNAGTGAFTIGPDKS